MAGCVSDQNSDITSEFWIIHLVWRTSSSTSPVCVEVAVPLSVGECTLLALFLFSKHDGYRDGLRLSRLEDDYYRDGHDGRNDSNDVGDFHFVL